MRPGTGFWVRAIWSVARRPSLWPTAVVQSMRLAGPGWWRHRPYVPVPDPGYLRFRIETQYGPAPGKDRMNPRDLVTYLEWCRSVAPGPPRLRRPRG